jgi:hypothetical protein
MADPGTQDENVRPSSIIGGKLKWILFEPEYAVPQLIFCIYVIDYVDML